ncbi:hypothetical protein [Streptomyces sp. NRRL F-5650]|uniref:hypothetical protein n=1 Tax=Streptomyces sp. NRRL F-5650 TaxID=1463868 RepID=UPI0006917B0B|nr:hypothetical protein [Streptomyces sp. NRRL F-5650]
MREQQAYAEKLESEAQASKDKAAGLQRELDGMPPKPGFAERLGDQTHEEKAKRERQEAAPYSPDSSAAGLSFRAWRSHSDCCGWSRSTLISDRSCCSVSSSPPQRSSSSASF